MTDIPMASAEHVDPSPPAEQSAPPPVLAVAGLAVFTAVGALSAIIEMLLIPLRHGTTLVPLAVLLAVAGNIALPRMAAIFTRTGVGSVFPVVGWIIATGALQVVPRPEGDVLLPSGSGITYVGFATILGGLFAGVITASLLQAGPRQGRLRYGAEQDSDPGTD
ncbi:DUF6113 family protein [Jatrophihabitans telluris]|uniref:DUF6113 family protein n=1 Tax=Jatrophihabitans telluris TaxID=2038343 RepID=A0ABY4QXT5_9ACTN|nr:DUF6113 family protein [Jatrophihabitans telluris]UQX87714.1 DUF6113 family protein [Jatrophihabitans telluris]